MIVGGLVHVVDDDESLRAAIGRLLRSVGYRVEMHASAISFADQYVASEMPACLLLDVRLPGISGLDFQSRLAKLGIDLPVVMMTGHGDIPMSVQAMKAGAVDFLPKHFRDQDLLDAVAAALERSVAKAAKDRNLHDLRIRFETLSAREREVMDHVTQGRLNKQVAGDLVLSEVTVKAHRGAAMRKMGARTLADLVKMSETLRVAG